MKTATIPLSKRSSISTSRRFIKNWVYLFSSRIFYQILGMLAMVRIARVLEPTGYGHYNLVHTTATIGLVLAGFGMRNLIIRDCANHPMRVRAIYSAGLIMRGLTGIVVAVGIITYSLISPDVLSTTLTGFVVMIMFGHILWDTAESISFGLQAMEYSSRIIAFGSVIWVLWLWCAPTSILTVAVVCFSSGMLQLIKAGILNWQVRRIIPSVEMRIKRTLRKESHQLITKSLPFFWLALTNVATIQLPILILAERSGPKEVGLFNVGFRLLNPLRLLIMTGFSVLYPYLSKARIQNSSQYMQAIEKALKFIVYIGGGCAFLISLFRTEFVHILFGVKYAGSAEPLAFQCWYTVFFAAIGLIGTSFMAYHKERLLAVLSTAYVVITTPIVWVGAAHGAIGLAVGIVVGVIINLIYHFYYFQKNLPSKLTIISALRYFIISSGAALGSLYIPVNISIISKLLISGIICLLIAKFLLKEWKSLVGYRL